MKIMFRRIGSDLLLLWTMATASLCMGLLVNQFRDKPLPLVYQTKEERVMSAVREIAAAPAALPANTPVAEYIGAEEFRAMVEGKRGIVLDARPEIFHRLGHVPGALSLPREDFQTAYAQHRQLLEANKEGVIAVYCSGSSCEDSDLVRKALQGLGYTRVTVFKGGWSDWTNAGLPEEKAL